MAEGRQDFRWTVKVVMPSLNGPWRTRGTDREAEWAMEDPRHGQRGTEESPPLPGRGRASIRSTVQPAQGCPWRCSRMAAVCSKSPLRYPLISQEKLLTLQELCLCPWPELECPPCLSPEGLSVPQNGFGISCLQEPSTGSHYLLLGCLAAEAFCKPPVPVCRCNWPDVLLASESCFSLPGRPPSAERTKLHFRTLPLGPKCLSQPEHTAHTKRTYEELKLTGWISCLHVTSVI